MAGEFKARNGIITPVLQSTVAIGTAPLIVTSTTLVTNLNADRLDGQDGSYYLDTSATGQTKTGSLTLSSFLKSAGLKDSSDRTLLVKNEAGTVVWGN